MAKITVLVLAANILLSEGTFAIGQMYFLPDVQDVTSVAWSPDGTHILSSGFDGTIRMWRADSCESGPLIYIDDPRVPEGEDAFRSVRRGVMSVAWSPDGKHFVAGLRDRTVRLYRLELDHPWRWIFEEIADFSVEGQTGLRTVAYSADGRMVASAGHDGSVRLWEAKKNGSLIRELKRHLDVVETIIFSNDAKIIISGGRDGSIKTWDVATGEIKSNVVISGLVWALTMSPDETLVAGAIARPDNKHFEVLVWRKSDWQELRSIENQNPVHSLAFSRDGSNIAGAGKEDIGETVWSVESGKPMVKFASSSGYSLQGISYSRDGHYLVAGTQGGTPILIRANTGEIVREFGKCPSPSERGKE